MKDLFKDYELQREELLARISESLQLDDTRRRKMEEAYGAISTILNDEKGFFKGAVIDVYPQGSVAIGTTSKPLRDNEFDLDIVVQINKLYSEFTSAEIYNELVRILSGNDRYKDKIEKKKRCIRLNYAGDFHMDILPGCLIFPSDNNNINIPDRELKTWAKSNPKGFAAYFLERANSVKASLLTRYYNQLVQLKAEIQDLPKDSFYKKTPLQRSVQLSKRYRDLYFEDKPKYATSSIVLTTLMMQFYQGEETIYYTIDNVLNKIKLSFDESIKQGKKFQVLNPVNNNENFTDSWDDKHYDEFYQFIADFHQRWQEMKNGFEKSGKDYIKLFGEGIYKQSLQDQVRQMGRFSTDEVTVANSIILGGTAMTNRKGLINENYGMKNEPHHNFGEITK